MPEIIERRQARSMGLTHYFTGYPCTHGHMCSRYVVNKLCLECAGVFGVRFHRFKETPAKQAVAEGRTRYFTGKPCIHGHLSERKVKDHSCIECEREKRRRKSKLPAAIAAKSRRQQLRRERMKSLGLTVAGKPRKRMVVADDERARRKRDLKKKQRLALRILEELGIEV